MIKTSTNMDFTSDEHIDNGDINNESPSRPSLNALQSIQYLFFVFGWIFIFRRQQDSDE